jgi:Peptidase M50B-like
VSPVLAQIEAELARLVRYDDESIVHDGWIRQRYDLGAASTYASARQAAVQTAWHEAGHAVAALATGARFSSVSIRHGHSGQGRVHGVQGGGFVVDAAGQIAERLRDWSMPAGDAELRAWLGTWRGDGGDARRFRRAMSARFGDDELAAWRHCERVMTPLRPRIRHVARALLVHPRYLRYDVVAAVAGLELTGGVNGRAGTRRGSRPVNRGPRRRPRPPAGGR